MPQKVSTNNEIIVLEMKMFGWVYAVFKTDFERKD
jgi:hypothetical protein